jgi:hypothetical protein
MDNECYNKLSNEYDNLFQENIETFNKNCNSKENEYCVFYPSFGIDRDGICEFLIYGQAVNIWEPNFKPIECKDSSELIKHAYKFSNSFYENEKHNPLDWVNVFWSKNTYKNEVGDSKSKEAFYEPMDYQVFRSFFWQVTYKTICEYLKLGYNSNDWTKKMVWSNLYKIAPANGGNPNNNEIEWQKEKSFELVKKEIDELKPKFIIVLTNDSWWEEFRKYLNSKSLPIKNEIITSVEKYNDFSKIIVTTRPFSGDSNNHVKAILEHLN